LLKPFRICFDGLIYGKKVKPC